LPFVELNGKQLSDSEIAIAELARVFNVKLDTQLSEFAAAEALAIHALIEDRIRWYMDRRVPFLSLIFYKLNIE
jgi:hypothetical protein